LADRCTRRGGFGTADASHPVIIVNTKEPALMSEVPPDLWTLDGHSDSVIQRLYDGAPTDLSPVEGKIYNMTLPRLRAGRMMGVGMMVGDKHLVPSLRMIEQMHELQRSRPADFAICLTATEVRAAVQAGRLGLVLTLEGQSMFEEKVELPRLWHRLGCRLYSLTHGEGTENIPTALQGSKSFFGYLSAPLREELRKAHKGLTAFGRQALGEMGRLGIACDLAHANDAAFWDTMEAATGPVCSTHAACAAIAPHSRNLTDEMLRALAQRKGVLGVCFYTPFVHQTAPTLDAYVEHILHALSILGEDGVGIGTDYDGGGDESNLVIRSPADMGNLWEALDKKGISRRVLVKIAHENWLRLLPA
jgi:membrane dipeptidase